jgi:flagellar assembly factor FliW
MMSDVFPSTDVPERLRLSTRFGLFDLRRGDCVTFPLGLPGFEQSRQFAVLRSEDFAPLQCLHAIEGEAVSFLVVDPRQVLPEYRCVLSQTDLMRLGATAEDVLLWLAIVTLDGGGQAFVNLRAPIVINPERMLGYQVMPHNSLYPLRHPLASE